MGYKQLRYALAAFSLLFLLPDASIGAGPNQREVVMAETAVAYGAPVSVTLTNPNHGAFYTIVTTANETGAASMLVKWFASTPLGDFRICQTAGITTETTGYYQLGKITNAGWGVTGTCHHPLARKIKIVFTQSNADTAFDVTAEVEWGTD